MARKSEHPLLFSAPMVQAIRLGQKTQTRRIIKKGAPPLDINHRFIDFGNGANWQAEQEGIHPSMWREIDKPLPYPWQVGDLLWVRETYQFLAIYDDLPPRDIPVDSSVWYLADGDSTDIFGKKRPGIFMPRWASRIALEVTAIRAERLQDISEQDAIAEGVDTKDSVAEKGGTWCYKPKKQYRFVWESINKSGSWDLNPWVWIIEFEVKNG